MICYAFSELQPKTDIFFCVCACVCVCVSGPWPKFEANYKPSELNLETHTPEQERPLVGQGQMRLRPHPVGNPAGIFCSRNSVSCTWGKKSQDILHPILVLQSISFPFSCRPPTLARSSLAPPSRSACLAFLCPLSPYFSFSLYIPENPGGVPGVLGQGDDADALAHVTWRTGKVGHLRSLWLPIPRKLGRGYVDFYVYFPFITPFIILSFISNKKEFSVKQN